MKFKGPARRLCGAVVIASIIIAWGATINLVISWSQSVLASFVRSGHTSVVRINDYTVYRSAERLQKRGVYCLHPLATA